MPKAKPRKPAQSLQDLQRKWYAKLAKSGFTDIEEQHSEREMLKRWDGHWFRTRGTPDQFLAKQRYFQLASNLLNHTEGWSTRERKVWALHCDGRSLREIGAALGINHEIANRIVRSLRKNIVWK